MAQYATYGHMRSSNMNGMQTGGSSSGLAHTYRRANSDDSGGSVDISVKRDLDDDDLEGGVGDEDGEGRPKKVLKRGAKACTAVRGPGVRGIVGVKADPPPVVRSAAR